MPHPASHASLPSGRALLWLLLLGALFAPLACSGRSKAEKLYREGNILYKNQQYYKAISKFEESLHLAPDQPDVLTQCADAYFRTNKPAQAVQYAEKAAKLAPDNFNTYLILGQAYLRQAYRTEDLSPGETSRLDPEILAKATQIARDLRLKKPNAVEGLIIQARINQEEARASLMNGHQATSRDELTSAATLFSQALHQVPDNTAARMGLTEVLLQQDKPVEAEQEARQLISAPQTPNKKGKGPSAAQDAAPSDAVRLLARSLAAQQKYDEAFTLLEPYIKEKTPNPDLNNYRLAGNVLLNQAQALAGDQPTSIPLQGPAPAGQGALQKAARRLADLGSVMKGLYPTDPYSFYFRAVSYQLQGRANDAIQHYQKAISLYESGQSATADTFRRTLVSYYLQQNQSSQALDALRDWLRLTPDNAAAQLMLAQVYVANGSLDQARDTLRQLITQHPDEMQAKSALANLLIQSTDDKSVQDGLALLTSLAQADNLAPGNREVLLGQSALREVDLARNAGKTDEARAKYSEAEQQFRKALELQPRNSSLAFLLANLAIRRNDLVTALMYTRQARQDNPRFAAPEATIFANLGQPDAAKKLYEEMLAKNPDSLELQLAIASMDTRLGDADAARQRLTGIIAKKPDDPRPYLLLASLAGRQQDLDEATRLLNDTLPRFPDNQALRAALAQLYLKANRPVEAITLLTETAHRLATSVDALRAKPEQKPLLASAAGALLSLNMDTALAHLLAGQGDKALALADQSLTLASQDLGLTPERLPQLLVLKAIAQLQTNHPPAALATLAQLTPESSAQTPALPVILALAHAAAGDAAAARASVEKQTGLPPKVLFLFYRLLESKRERLAIVAPILALQRTITARPDFAPAALALADAAVKEMPNAAFPLYCRIEALRLAVRDDDALKACDDLEHLLPDYDAIKIFRADVHLALSIQATARHDQATHDAEQAKAIALYRAYLKKVPGDPETLLGLATLLQGAGQTPEANQLYSQVIAVDPNNWTAYNNLAWNLAQSQQLDKAAEQGEKALQLATAQQDPRIGGVQDTLGWIEFGRSHFERAADLLTQASQTMPNNPEIRFHLAQALQKQGQTARAIAQLEAITLATPFYARLNEVTALLHELKAAPPAANAPVTTGAR